MFGLLWILFFVSGRHKKRAQARSSLRGSCYWCSRPYTAGADWDYVVLTGGASSVLANDTDVEGDTLSLVSVGLPTLAGASVILTNDSARYWPPPRSVAADEFSYEVSDGMGGLTAGMVTVQVQDEPVAFERLTIEYAGGNTLQIRLQGVAGWTYTLQSTGILGAYGWQNAGVVETDSNGAATIILPWSPDDTTKLYRSVRGRSP